MQRRLISLSAIAILLALLLSSASASATPANNSALAQNAPNMRFLPQAPNASDLPQQQTEVSRITAPPQRFSDRWLVAVTSGANPNNLAASLGFTNLGNLAGLPNLYIFQVPNGDQAYSAATTQQVIQTLAAHPSVEFFEREIFYDVEPYDPPPTDPLFTNQWHLRNTGQFGGTSGADANLVPAWAANYTGQGIHIGIVDDGLEYTHPDLASRYVAARSYDYADGDTNPAPRRNSVGCAGIVQNGTDDCHGTSVAGVAAAAANNGSCGAGAAYNASLSAQRLITGKVITNFEIANALLNTLAANTSPLDVSNNSWGPAGTSVPTFSAAVESALQQGAATNRTIYVWAAGNSNYIGTGNTIAHGYRNIYANSRYTINVGASNNRGVRSAYSEQAASLIVNAPSSGFGAGFDGSTANVYTTDLTGAGKGYGGAGNDCTSQFGGTSSSAPLVSGIVALILQANPSLTWRDVQHILINSARRNDPSHASWQQNGADRWTSDHYGFGTVDAGAAVNLASNWTNAGPYLNQNSATINVNQPIADGAGNPPNNTYGTAVNSNLNFNATQIKALEHVEVLVNINHNFSGDLRILLTSPSGTVSRLTDITNWSHNFGLNGGRIIMSTQFWGENPNGTWTISVQDGWGGETGTFVSWQLRAYGTAVAPNQRDTLALFNPTTGQASLINSLANNPATGAYNTYTPNAPIPANASNIWVMGDWNGNGQKTPGVYRNGAFHLTNSIGASTTWTSHWIGILNPVEVLAGRFNSNLPNDCIGAVEQATLSGFTVFVMYYTCNFASTTPPVTWHWISAPLATQDGFSGAFQFVVGDWNGNSADTVGVRRGEYIAFTNARIVDPAFSGGAPFSPNNTPATFTLAQYWGAPDANPGAFVAGDWDNNGVDSFGVFYSVSNRLIYRNNLAWNEPVNFIQNLTNPIGTPRQVRSWRSNAAASLVAGGIDLDGFAPLDGLDGISSLEDDPSGNLELIPLEEFHPLDEISPLEDMQTP